MGKGDIGLKSVFSQMISADNADGLPALPGSYALRLRLAKDSILQVGRLGQFRFSRGDYIYLGSALGPGGLRARLGRHLRGDGRLRWHIDTLREAAQVFGFHYIISPLSLECRWAQALVAMPGSSMPVPGFGASDCHSGCRAHLIFFKEDAFPAVFPYPA